LFPLAARRFLFSPPSSSPGKTAAPCCLGGFFLSLSPPVGKPRDRFSLRGARKDIPNVIITGHRFIPPSQFASPFLKLEAVQPGFIFSPLTHGTPGPWVRSGNSRSRATNALVAEYYPRLYVRCNTPVPRFPNR